MASIRNETKWESASNLFSAFHVTFIPDNSNGEHYMLLHVLLHGLLHDLFTLHV